MAGSSPPETSSADVRIALFCAPSRTSRGAKFDVARAVDFAHGQLGFTGRVAYSGVTDGVRLEVDEPSGFTDYVWVCTNGKLDASMSLPVSIGGDGRRVLDVFDLLSPIATVAVAIRSTAYLAVHQLPPRKARQPIDLLIGVSMYGRLDDGRSIPSWEDLAFPVSPPPRIVTDRGPFCPAAGYGADRLRGSWRRPLTLEQILTAFLSSFLAENGFHDFEGAVDDTVSAFVSERYGLR